MNELVRRWDLKIAEVYARVHAMLSEAVVASEPILATIRADLNPIVLPWNTITPRVRAACDEISEAWNAISDEMSASGTFTHEMMQHEGNKRDVATCELQLLHERMQGSVMARAAEQVQLVDQRMFAAIGAMHLAAEAARPAYEEMRRLDTRIKQYRDAKDVPLALLAEYEMTSRAYWSTRLGEEARHDPAQVPYVAAKLDRYMKDVYRTLRRYWQWRAHETAAVRS